MGGAGWLLARGQDRQDDGGGKVGVALNGGPAREPSLTLHTVQDIQTNCVVVEDLVW